MDAFSALSEMERKIVEAAMSKTQDCMYDLLDRSVQQAPLDTGDLRGSGNVKVDGGGDSIEFSVGFNAPYARKQHENLTYKHPKGGKAKYLEDPWNENKDRYIASIHNAITDAIKG